MLVSFFSFSAFQNKCGKNGQKCKNNSTCQSGFTQKGYRCLYTAGFEGEHCERGKCVRNYC